MSILRKMVLAVVVALGLFIATSPAANASHWWYPLHWRHTTSAVTVRVIDQTRYNTYLDQAVYDWSKSSKFNLAKVSSCTSRCVTVKDVWAGKTGWTGVAMLFWDQNNHIVGTVVKLNLSYLAYYSHAWQDHTVCQEVGHALGLKHINEYMYNKNLGSCMDYSAHPERNDGYGTNLHPSSHDYWELYYIQTRHIDYYNTVVSSTTTASALAAARDAGIPLPKGAVGVSFHPVPAPFAAPSPQAARNLTELELVE